MTSSRLPSSMRVLVETLRPRGRQNGRARRHRSLRRLAEERRQVGQGDQLPPRARPHAGLHRRAGRRRPRRHARRHGQARRRSAADQSAAAGRSRHRPLGAGGRLRHGRGLRRQREARVRAQPSSATSSCAGGRWRSRTSASCRRAPASAIRSTSSTWRVVFAKKVGKETIAYPDTLVGTDSHTTMINGLGVLGWGVGGIEAEAAMLGQPVSMLMPEVIGFELKGKLPRGRHRHRPRADRHRSCCARRAWSASSSSSSATA